MTEHRCDNGNWVVSAYNVWCPGVYNSKRTAKYSLRFSDEEIMSIWDPIGEDVEVTRGPITFKELQELRKRRREPPNPKLERPK